MMQLKQSVSKRTGFKLKMKSYYQLDQLWQFFGRTISSKWKRKDIEKLAEKIQLDFKSTNKWLWDQKNRIEIKSYETQQELIKQVSSIN